MKKINLTIKSKLFILVILTIKMDLIILYSKTQLDWTDVIDFMEKHKQKTDIEHIDRVIDNGKLSLKLVTY
jgi:hypothetical protein